MGQFGSVDAKLLKEACERMRGRVEEIPCVVNGQEIRTSEVLQQVVCSDHQVVLAKFHQASKEVLLDAIAGAMAAKATWEALDFEDRAAIFLKAADLLNTTYRYEMMAATMLGQGKAEIDCMAETIDFFRFNVEYMTQIYAQQPPKNSHGVWNRVEYRPLEGYVVAITPFNFTAIGANLPTSPAMMGNVVLWKPASTAVLSNWILYKVLREAGLPPGVIQFVPGAGRVVGDTLINHRDFAGLHFTGSTGVFNGIMHRSATNLNNNLYRAYPRIVGETGGKDFHVVHESAHLETAVNCTLRGAFEYQGQKCSATSRVYVSDKIWPEFRHQLVERVKEIKMSQSDDFSAFMSAVIDKASFDKCQSYIQHAQQADDAEVIVGGGCDASKGWFVEPTIILTSNPHYKSMEEEIFGPILTIFVYNSANGLEEMVRVLDSTSPYALTGAIFAQDRVVINKLTTLLRHNAGNFYVNDKSTGAVVGQQPFGGARASGTNDKAGSFLNLLRWVSARSIKETFTHTTSWKYPHMGQ